MAHFERDKDDVRVYDGSEDEEDGEGSHLPVVIIIAILVLAAFGGVVWLAYNQGVARGRNDPIRVATAESANAGSGIKVYQQPAGAEDEDEPAAKPAAATESAAKPAAAPQPAAQTAPPPVTTAASPPPLPAKPAVTMAQAKPQAQTTLTPAKPQPTPPVVATKPPAQLGLARPAPTTPPPVAKAPTAAAATKPVTTTAAASTAAKPVTTTATAAAKPSAPPKPVAAAATKPAAGAYLLQVGAYKSEAEATAAWKTYQSKHAALLAGFGPDVQRADLGDKGVWYRLRISSFADRDAAVALCERLKSQNGACFLAR